MNYKMKRSNKGLVLIISMGIIAVLITGIVFASSNKSSGHGMGESTPVATTKDRDRFIDLWKKAYIEAGLKAEQKIKLSADLENNSDKLKENYASLMSYRDQKAKAKGEEAAKLQKRIDLKESERDLIISQVEMSMKKYLNADQLDLVMMAGFHGVSISYSGDKHMSGMDMKNDSKVGKMATDLSELAGKLNRNCEAVTLELIRKNL